MTVDVRVRRCTLTIRRRDGWSWGASPRPHIEAALAGVEAALEAAIAEAGVAAGVNAHLDEPVRLQLGSDGIVTAASWNDLVEQLRGLDVDAPDAAAAGRPSDEASGGAPGAGGEPPPGTAGAVAGDVDSAGDVVLLEYAAGALARTLARWSRGGQMERIVNAWPAELVRTWSKAIAAAARLPGAIVAPGALTAEAVDLIAEGVLGSEPPGPSTRQAADRLLVLLAAITAALGDRLPDGGTQALARMRVATGDEPVAPADDATHAPDRQPIAADAEPIASADDTTHAPDRQHATDDDEPIATADDTTHTPDQKHATADDEPIAAVADTTDAASRQPITADDKPIASADDTTHTPDQQHATADDKPIATADDTTHTPDQQHATADHKPIASADDTTHTPDQQHATADHKPIASADDTTHAPDQQRVAAGDERVANAPRAAASQTGTASSSRTRGAATTGHPAAPVEQVVPALPLLVLAQLSRIGYVDAIVSAAAVAGLPGGAGALGAAVAGKVLPPPGRGWSREPAETAAIALASGGPAEQMPEALEAIAEREHELVAMLGAALQAAYAEGRSANDELLVWAGDEGIVCGEEKGLLPAAWVASEPELDAVLASLGMPPVRRGDDFQALARALHERPGLPRTDAPALERQLGAAAGTALGLIALGLWGSAGQAATPLLALERLGDLEARVRRERGGLLVSIPRGQRWLDLRRGGLLELFSIAWLPAGRLEIGTW